MAKKTAPQLEGDETTTVASNRAGAKLVWRTAAQLAAQIGEDTAVRVSVKDLTNLHVKAATDAARKAILG